MVLTDEIVPLNMADQLNVYLFFVFVFQCLFLSGKKKESENVKKNKGDLNCFFFFKAQ